MSAVVTDNYHWVITAVHNVSVTSSRLQRVGALEKEDRIDEIKYSPPVPYFLQPPNYSCTHMKYMDLLRNRAVIETYMYYYTAVVKRNTFISYLYFLSDVYVLIIYEWPTIKTSSLRFCINLSKAVH